MARFRPIFDEITAGTVARETSHRPPAAEIAALKAAEFGTLRVPEQKRGFGATLPKLSTC